MSDGEGDMTGEEGKRMEALWGRFVEREPLAPQERAELAAGLEGDEILRRRLLNDLQVDGALRAVAELELGQEHTVAQIKALVMASSRTEEVVAAVRKRLEAKVEARARGPVAHPARPRPSWRPRATHWLAAATVALGAAAVLMWWSPAADMEKRPGSVAERDRGGRTLATPGTGARSSERPPRLPAPASAVVAPVELPPAGGVRLVVGTLEAIEGPAYRHGPEGIQRVASAVQLAAGDWVSTSGEAARARVNGPGASRIELSGDTVVAFTVEAAQPKGARLFFAQGRANAVLPSAAPAGEAVVLATPHALVTGQGRYRLAVGSAMTKLEVLDGRARVSALGVQRGTEIGAGQFTIVSADDLRPPRAQNSTRDALLVIGPDDTKEEPTAAGGLRASEERLKSRLERLGFRVEVADASALTPEHARAASLLVFSSSVSSKQLRPWFGELPVPMLVLESTGFERLGMTGTIWRRDLGPAPKSTDLVIQNPAHPLAAGFSGTVRVMNASLNLRWATPPPGATVIASYAGAPAHHSSVLFGYERGALTANGTAPARRVGLFLGNGKVILALTEQGWRLFDAAAIWAAAAD